MRSMRLPEGEFLVVYSFGNTESPALRVADVFAKQPRKCHVHILKVEGQSYELKRSDPVHQLRRILKVHRSLR